MSRTDDRAEDPAPTPSSALSTRRRVVRRPDLGLLAGTAAGIAEAYDLDPWLVRAAFIAAGFVNALGLVFYGVCWMLLPAATRDPR